MTEQYSQIPPELNLQTSTVTCQSLLRKCTDGAAFAHPFFFEICTALRRSYTDPVSGFKPGNANDFR